MTPAIHIDIVTIFHEMFTAMQYGITGRALQNHLVEINYFNPRDYAENKYGKIDDKSYGGGPGMVMMVEPLRKAILAAKKHSPAKTILLTPQGNLLTQEKVKAIAQNKHLILVCGRYEGIDQRLIDLEVDEEISIGDYILSGGEIASMALLDAIIRLIPGALGDDTSSLNDSFTDGLLEYPQYTRPEKIHEKSVPNVLLSGNHEEINRWRLQQSLGKTYIKRPDLLQKRKLTTLESVLLSEFVAKNREDNNE